MADVNFSDLYQRLMYTCTFACICVCVWECVNGWTHILTCMRKITRKFYHEEHFSTSISRCNEKQLNCGKNYWNDFKIISLFSKTSDVLIFFWLSSCLLVFWGRAIGSDCGLKWCIYISSPVFYRHKLSCVLKHLQTTLWIVDTLFWLWSHAATTLNTALLLANVHA